MYVSNDKNQTLQNWALYYTPNSFLKEKMREKNLTEGERF